LADAHHPVPCDVLIIIGLAIYQLKRVKRSQEKRGEHPGGIAGPD